MNPGDKVQTDEEWLDFARANGQTTYHVIGTCKMGQDPMAVVDDQLRVHGHRRVARDRCLDHADGDVGQYQCRGHHDRGKGRRHDQGGGDAAGARGGMTN